MAGRLWQQPYVNIFKHFKIDEWKKSSREGDVSTVMDKLLKCTVYRISGSVPAGNYIQFPKASSQSLALTGHYLYILFKPIATKYFIVHLDVATDDGLIIRISFSNLFKEFKSTSTWLQFPFISNPPPGSVEDAIACEVSLESKVGNAPVSSRWTLLCLDLHYILSVYLNRKYAYLKTIRLCANMFLKNVFTSDTSYQPGVSMKIARKKGLISHGFVPLPREMSFPSSDLSEWQKRYDFVKFPSDVTTGHDVIPGLPKSLKNQTASQLGAMSPRRDIIQADKEIQKQPHQKSRRNKTRYSATQYVSQNYSRNPIKARVALVDKLMSKHSLQEKRLAVSLPEVGINNSFDDSMKNNGVDVYAFPDKDVVIEDKPDRKENINKQIVRSYSTELPSTPSDPILIAADMKSLQPDPILKLAQIVGFGGANTKTLLWTRDNAELVYPCHSAIVSLNVETEKQSFLLGHNEKVSALAFNGNTTLLASVQTGEDSIARIWRYSTKKCLAVFQTNLNDPYCLSFSQSGSKLCAVGFGNQGKQAIAVWDASFIPNGGKVTLIAKAHVDISIESILIAPFNDTL
eukprot:gene8706-9635_t